MCDHGFIGACAVCDGSGQVPERCQHGEYIEFGCSKCHDEDVWPEVDFAPTYHDPSTRPIER